MNYQFVQRDVGKGHERGNTRDCTVRALTVAAGIRYSDAWRLLYEAHARHKACGFDVVAFFKAEPERFGIVREIPFPSVRGQPRMTPRAFADRHPRGNFILRIANHVAAIEDGRLFDTWDCGDRCVYTAWEIDPRAFRKEGQP